MYKIFRLLSSVYTPSEPLKALYKPRLIGLPKPIITIMSADQGFGQIKGTTKKVGENYSPVPVCCFRRSTRQLLWETTSKPDGTYAFRNILKGLECFIVAFDPNEEYNAVISDKVVAK